MCPALRKKAHQVPPHRTLPSWDIHAGTCSRRLTDRAAAHPSTDNASQSPTPAGSAPSERERAQLSAARPVPPFASTTSTVADAPIADTVMTSIETLPPNTSQTSANSGASKRITSNGRQVVLNSDSDSDSMGELDFGIPAPKPKPQTFTSRSSRRLVIDEPELRKPPKSAKNSNKRSFHQLLEAAQKNLDTERTIQERKADLEQADEQPAPVATSIDKTTLKQAIQDGQDSDQADRLYKAMQRTNEVQAQTAYHFFEYAPSLALVPPFPQHSLPDHGWTACFQGTTRVN